MSKLTTITVLLVEDEAGDAALTKITLKQKTEIYFNVQWVTSLELAKQALANSHFDVILLDLSLQETQGLETLELARKIAPEIPIVVLTSRVDVEFALTALKIGATDYASKDIIQNPSSSLSRVIRYALMRVELDKK